MKNKNRVKLYNVLFPFWMLLLFPQMWLVILPGNFIIDSLVLIIGMSALKIVDKKQWYKKHILKIFLFGMLSDIIAAGYMLLMVMTVLKDVIVMADELYLTLPAVIMAAALIFVFNYFFTFKKNEKLLRLKFSLLFAVVTAPTTFLFHSICLY